MTQKQELQERCKTCNIIGVACGDCGTYKALKASWKEEFLEEQIKRSLTEFIKIYNQK